jgi:hypothetical protein
MDKIEKVNLDSQVCLMCHIMDINHDQSILSLNLDSNTCEIVLKNTNPITTKRQKLPRKHINILHTTC